MKKILSILAVLLCMAAIPKAHAYNFESGGVYYNITGSSPNTVAVTYATGSYNSYSGTVDIPNTVTYNGTTYTVTAIGNNAFRDCSNLTEVTIPETVESIGEYAFSGCSQLTAVTIPNGVKTIEAWAFSGSGLVSVSIPNSVITIGQGAYSTCSALTTVIFNADSCYSMIGDAHHDNYGSVFGSYYYPYENYSITTLIIGNNVQIIPDFAFADLKGIETVNIPNSVTSIGSHAFSGCTNLTSVNIPNSVTSIGDLAFSKCINIASFNVASGNPVYDSRNNCNAIILTATNTLLYGCQNTVIPNTIVTIGDYAFSEYSTLSAIPSFPNSVKHIGQNAFNLCTALTGTLTISDYIETIGPDAFKGCTGLTSVVIGKSVDSIGDGAFGECQLSSVVFNADSCTVMGHWYHNASGNIYSSVFGHNYTVVSLTIGNNVKAIPYGAFYRFEALSSLSIPNSVRCIGDYAFYGNGLTGMLFIPNSVTYIGNSAFYQCSGITGTLNIPNSVTYIGDNAFSECTGITGTLTIPNSVIYIGGRAFNRCSISSVAFNADSCSSGFSPFISCNNLVSLTIGNTVKIIPYAVFEECHNLTGELLIPNSVIRIEERAFRSCTNLTGNLTLPSSLSYIGDYAFSGCTGFSGKLIIPDSVVTIGREAFRYIAGIDSLIIGKSVKSFGYNVFGECSSLSYIAFNADSCTQMSQQFSDCDSLTTLTIGDNVKNIPDQAFFDCDKLTGKLTIPNSVINIGARAFNGCSGFDTLVIGRAVKNIFYSNSYYQTYTPFSGCTGLTCLVYNADSCNNWSASENSSMFSGITSLIIGENVRYIPRYAFHFLGISGTLVIPNSVRHIGRESFKFSGIDTLIIGKSVALIDSAAFRNCGNLKHVVFNADSCHVNWVYNGFPFQNCDSISSISIGDNVKAIPDYIFYGKDKITGTLNIPNSVRIIGNSAFSDCSGLTQLIIGRSVESIGSGAFSYCSGLTSITSYNATPPTLNLNPSHPFSSVSRNTPVYVTCGSAQDYRNAWKYSTTNTNSYFYNIYENLQPYQLTVLSSDTLRGSVQITQHATCTEPATVEATPNFFYVFEHWSDSNTDNPRTIELTQDTVLVAHFREYAVTVVSNDTAAGAAYLTAQPTLENPQATVTAQTTDSCYVFTGWSNGSTDNPLTISVSQDTTLTAIFNSVVNLQLSVPVTICQGDSTILVASGADSYLWFNGETSPVISILPENTLEVSVTGTNQNGCSTTKRHQIGVLPKPTLTLSGITDICEGDSTVIEAISLEASYYILNENFDGGIPSNWTLSNNLLHTENLSGNHNIAIIFPAYDVTDNDELTMPILKTTALHEPILQFDVAYKPYGINYNEEKLSVYYSSNNGESWTQVYSKTGNELSTVSGYSSQSFVPTDEQWRTESIDLSNISGNIIIKFTFESGWGNNVWLDNIIVKSKINTHNVLLSENFETVLSEDWSIVDVDGDGYSWYPASRINYGMAPDPYSGNYCAIAFVQNYYSSYTYENRLSTPTVTIPETGATLEWVANSSYGQYSSYEVRVVSNSGSTMIYSGTEYGSDNWSKRSVNLGNWAGQNIKVVFVHLGGPALMIDDMVIVAKENYVWSDGTVSSQHSFTSSGTWQVTFTDKNGCSTTDSVTISVWQPDTIELTVTAPTNPYVLNGESFCTSGDYTQILQNIHGCDSVVNLHLTMSSDTTVIYDTLCAGSKLIQQVYISPEEYQQILTMLEYQYGNTLPFELSYDSLTHIVTLKQVSISFYEQWEVGYIEYGYPIYDNFDTTLYLNYNVWKDSAYYDNFSYTITYPTSSGCDSTVTWHRRILFSDNANYFVSACGRHIWQGDSLFGWNENTGDYQIYHAGDTLTQSGDYAQVYTCENGCDSIIYLHFEFIPASYEDISAIACNSYTYNGVTYTESGDYTFNTDTILAVVRELYYYGYNGWGYNDSDGNFISFRPNGWSNLYDEYNYETDTYTYYYYDQDGVYHPYLGETVLYNDTILACKSITLHLTINHPITGDTTAIACNSFTWQGSNYTESGDYSFSTTASNSCDSVITLHLTVNHSNTSDTTAVACDSFVWHGETYTQSGTYPLTLTNAEGCDSIVTLHLFINSSDHTELTAVDCGEYVWLDSTYTESGTYTVTYTNAAGCDSIVTLHLTINPIPEVTITGNTTICPGGGTMLTATGADSYLWSNYSTNASIPVNMFGVYSVTGTTAAGCFNTATVTVLVADPPVITITGETDICSGETTTLTANGGMTYLWSNGSTDSVLTVNAAGSWQVIGYDENGCNGMVSVTVNLWQPATSSLYITSFDSCYTWFGTSYCQSGDYTHTLQTIHGCDSVITLHLTLEEAIITEFSATGCDSYTWNGITYSQSGNYTQNFTAANGSDSIVTLHLTLMTDYVPQIMANGTLSACGEGSVTLSVDSPFPEYLWSTGDITSSVTIGTAGYYWVTVGDGSGCTSVSEQVHIGVSELITETPSICMVGVENNHNLVVWEELNDPDVVGYQLYRENGQANVFEPLAFVSAGSTNAYEDTTADPAVRAYRYRITTVDTCGGETPMSEYHKTVHLTINQGLGNSYNLIWTPYEGFEFSSYKLYRGTANNNLQLIQTMPSTLTSFTDNNPTGDALFYQIEVVMNGSCVQNPRDITFTGARSNIVYNGTPVTTEVSVNACDSYDWNGQHLTSSGDYTQTFSSLLGYDSVVTLHLTVNNSVISEFSVECPDSCYTWNDVDYCESGNYTQTLQTVHGCDSVVTLHLTITVGLDDYNGFDFKVYPNPTSNIVNVQCTMNNVQVETMEILVYDAFGRLLRSTDGVETQNFASLQTDTHGSSVQTQIDLSRYATGVYFVKAVADGKTVAVRKVVKQ